MELALGVIRRGWVQPQKLVLVRLGDCDVWVGVSDVVPRHVCRLVNDLAVRAWEGIFTVVSKADSMRDTYRCSLRMRFGSNPSAASKSA